MPDLHIIGVPFNSDGTPPEVENPPDHLRRAGLLDELAATHAVRDHGDLPIPAAPGTRDAATGILNWPGWRTVTRRVAATVSHVLLAGGWPLVIGGDCSILVGIMAGARAVMPRCGLFFVDGHGDFHTPASSPTAEPADMELAALTGRAPSPASDVSLGDEDIVVFGVREWDGLDRAPIEVVDYARLAEEDLASAVRVSAQVLSHLPVWLHFDVDSIDAELMPVLFPAGRGLTFPQTVTLLRTLLEAGHVIGMDVACFHPNLDSDGSATTGLVDLLTTVLSGRTLPGTRPNTR